MKRLQHFDPDTSDFGEVVKKYDFASFNKNYLSQQCIKFKSNITIPKNEFNVLI